jgi:hypothetical protein
VPNVERTSSYRILKGTAGSLEITVYSDGAKIDPTVPSVVAVDDTGAAVTLGAATLAGGDSGKVTAAILPAATANVGRITATWTLTVDGVAQNFTTYHEIVGDLLFTEAEMRAFDKGAVAPAKYTDAQILAMHDLVKDSFETKVGVAFGLTFTREILSGPGISLLMLGNQKVQSIRAAATRVTTTWTALTATELEGVILGDFGMLERETAVWPLGTRNIRVDYEHGYQPIPHEIKEAAKWLAREWLVGSDIPARATSMVAPEGTYQLATAGVRGSIYGLPLVDRVISDYAARHYIPGIA